MEMSQDYAKLTVPQLKKLLEEKGIAYHGEKKSGIIELLMTQVNQESNESQESDVEVNAKEDVGVNDADDNVGEDDVQVVLQSVTADSAKIQELKLQLAIEKLKLNS
jgi:hypothetical protein